MDQQRTDGRIAAKVRRGTPDAGGVGQEGERSPRTKNRGLGRIIIAVYGVFALSAFARSFWQLVGSEHGEKILPQAPVAIILSVISALIYIVATVSLARSSRRSWTVALCAVIAEIVGVVAVSILSLAAPELFPKASVWSDFGQGYGYVPAVLPLVGLWWLLTHRPRATDAGRAA